MKERGTQCERRRLSNAEKEAFFALARSESASFQFNRQVSNAFVSAMRAYAYLCKTVQNEHNNFNKDRVFVTVYCGVFLRPRSQYL